MSLQVKSSDSPKKQTGSSSIVTVKNGLTAESSKEKTNHQSKKRKRKTLDPQKEPKNETTNGNPEPSTNGTSAPKMNAFQFMMNSRHRSIGRNSPGRELDLNQSADVVVSRKDLTARKSRLENWAEKKGAAKRKREYEEVGNCISHKLEKRGKKMKKLLKMGCESDDEVITKRKKRRAKIQSDSDDEVEEKDELHKKKIAGKVMSKSAKAWKIKLKLHVDENKENGSEDFEENGENQKCIFMNSEENGENATVVEDKESGNESFQENIKPESVENKKSSSSDDCVLVSPEKTEDNENVPEKRVLRTRKSKPKIYDDFLMSDDDEATPKNKKSLKVAPVFLKSTPKPKLDPKLVEAKRQFLLSGMPPSLKKELEKQQCVDELEFDVFPSISHVQQKCPDNPFWDLPKVELKLTTIENEKFQIQPCSNLLVLDSSCDVTTSDRSAVGNFKNCKKIIRDIKSQHPDYPVYKIFNSIYARNCHKSEKCEKVEAKITPKRRGRPRKKSPEKKTEVPTKPEAQNEEVQAMWTEKYKPRSSSDIIGNNSGVSSLKEWLTNWTKLRKKQSDSESEFDITDSDSRDSAKLCGNTVILKGPTGSGKSSAVYALCTELGFSVLEVNASSKRTGKRLLQQLQEATQSHQVCKSQNTFKEKTEEVPKKCVLLVDDVDIVFEQDEGFSAALSQIIATSKRPIILTMTEWPCHSVQKIINEHRVINFSSSSPVLSLWLQIVCLVEGVYVNLRSVEELLSVNRGDIRRTLLQLQFCVNSQGGNTAKTEESKVDLCFLDEKIEDDSSSITDDSNNDVKGWIFTPPSPPSCDNLETIWWNWSSILRLPQTSEVFDRAKIQSLVDCFDALSFADFVCGKDQFHESLERRWRSKTKDSLALEENMADCKENGGFCDAAQFVVDRSVKLYKDRSDDGFAQLNMAVPPVAQKRLRSKQFSAEDNLLQVLPVSEFLNRKAISLDYAPYLRSIARSELERATNTTKRSHRFYHYLKNLGVRCSDSCYKLACDVFQ